MTLAEILRSQAKKFEKEGTVGVFRDFSKGVLEHEAFATPSPILNAVLGKGIPRGFITELYGEEGTGKTTICIQVCAKVQQDNPEAVVAYLDYEHAFDPVYAAHLGLDLDPKRFVFLQPETFEQGADTVLKLMEADLIDLYVVDSATAMLPRAIVESEFGDSKSAGQQARLFSEWMPRISGKITRGREPAVILINQMRMKIDFKNPWKNGLDSAAANAIKFYSGVRLKLDLMRGEDKSGQDKNAAVQVQYKGARVRVTTLKSRVAPPFRQGRLVFVFGEGLDNTDSLLEMAEKHLGIKHGSYFKWEPPNGEEGFSIQGRENTLIYLKQNLGITHSLEQTLQALITSTNTPTSTRTIKPQNDTQDDAAEEEDLSIYDD
jgi:recombination protein RecA